MPNFPDIGHIDQRLASTASGRWVRQTIEVESAVFSHVVVGGVTYLLCGVNDDGWVTVIQVRPDGYFKEWPLYTSSGWQNKAYAVVGSKIYLPFNVNNGNVVTIFVFDTVTKVTTSLTVTNPGLGGAQYGTGCLAPDGLVYFPPNRAPAGFNLLKPLAIDPATNIGTPTDFGGTWVMNESSGTFTMGGGADSNRMYFTPGLLTAAGGSYASGTRIGYITFPAKTVTYLTMPPSPIYSSQLEDTFYWAMPRAAGGIYALSMDSGFYKITTAGATLLQTSYIYSDSYIDNGELTDQATFNGDAAMGPDGLLYTVGTGYVPSTPTAPSSYPPVIGFIDPATDAVHFKELYEYSGYPWIPSATYAYGAGMRTFPIACCRSPFVEIFESSVVVPAAASLSLDLGDVPAGH